MSDSDVVVDISDIPISDPHDPNVVLIFDTTLRDGE